MMIVDSLRQECMPEMVYVICKLAGGNKKYAKDEFKKLITLGDVKAPEFDKVFKFSLDCNFIKITEKGTVSTEFNENQLESFHNFRVYVSQSIFQNKDTAFTLLSKWILTQSSDIFGYKSAEEFAREIPRGIDFGITIEENFAQGFRFWFEALGLGKIQKSGVGSTLIFACDGIIFDWLKYSKPYNAGDRVLVKRFIAQLLKDCPQFVNAIDGNTIKQSLSMGLRVLHDLNVINLKYSPDSSDIWYLTKSINYSDTNKISEIIVGEYTWIK